MISSFTEYFNLGFLFRILTLVLVGFLVPSANAEEDLQGMRDAVTMCHAIPKSACIHPDDITVDVYKQADGYAIVGVGHKGDKKEDFVPALLKKIEGHWVELDEGTGIDWSEWEHELPQALK
jgi:hypothetical protein